MDTLTLILTHIICMIAGMLLMGILAGVKVSDAVHGESYWRAAYFNLKTYGKEVPDETIDTKF